MRERVCLKVQQSGSTSYIASGDYKELVIYLLFIAHLYSFCQWSDSYNVDLIIDHSGVWRTVNNWTVFLKSGPVYAVGLGVRPTRDPYSAMAVCKNLPPSHKIIWSYHSRNQFFRKDCILCCVIWPIPGEDLELVPYYFFPCLGAETCWYTSSIHTTLCICIHLELILIHQILEH